uniref:Uncharacterized protein n=1 Tax=Amphimedon queenslandica TaxID=400682 RepID=A0A1X7SMT3_AMPQE
VVSVLALISIQLVRIMADPKTARDTLVTLGTSHPLEGTLKLSCTMIRFH